MLVGGEGTRLRPLTYTTPKQLLPVAEVALLERVLLQLAGHGVDEAVLSLGYRPDSFLDAYPDGSAAGVALRYAVEPEPLDTAGAVRFSAGVDELDETFLVVNGDVLTDLDITALVAFHRSHGALATIALTAVEDPSRFGVVPTDDDGRVQTFLEKPPPGEAPTNRVNAGTYVLEPEILSRIPEGRRVSIERETFPALVADGAVYARYDAGYWLDTGTPEAYIAANADLLNGRRAFPPAPGARALSDGVWALGHPVVRGEVLPASMVGDGALVGEGASVRASVIGAGCRLEPGASVEGSVLLPGACIGAGAVVLGSIVGKGAVVGPDCVLEPTCVLGDRTVVEAGSRLADARVPAAGGGDGDR